MEKWVLSIVGIVALSVLLDIVIPEGSLNKYIKGIFAIMTICVIVSPLPMFVENIKNKRVDELYEEVISSDEEVIESMNNRYNSIISNNIEKVLKSKGIEGVEVTIVDETYDNSVEKLIVTIDKIEQEAKVKDIIKEYVKMNIKEVVIVGR